ncbi:MAG: TIGR00730 family Rossman fold protein [Stomatobaculum sp.]|nr:TIGR00730 family Rossman fold protein [Stomatobaculum sp.]
MNIVVYLGARTGKNPLFREKARELGTWIAEKGHRLIYGGSAIGLMGQLADAALAAGGEVTGVEPRFFVEAVLQHQGVQELIVVETMQERKQKLIDLGDAFIAFPGGTGTMEEISEIISMTCLGLNDKPCIIYNINGYYDIFSDHLDRMVQEEFLTPENRRKILFVRSIEELEALLG